LESSNNINIIHWYSTFEDDSNLCLILIIWFFIDYLDFMLECGMFDLTKFRNVVLPATAIQYYAVELINMVDYLHKRGFVIIFKLLYCY
jgi:serine/threonine protein kinase